MSYPKVYRVNYGFTADSDVEITVTAGEIVVAQQSPQDMWIHVSKFTKPEIKGYIPYEYVEELSPQEAKPYLVASSGSPRKSQSSSVAAGGPPTTAASSAPYQYRTPVPTSASAVSQRSVTSSLTATGVSDTFAQHEVQFRQILKAREETFRKLEASLQATADEVRQCQGRNADLGGKIRELDSMIEEERRKWKDRLEIEKKQLQTAI
eukprot:ANDGO_07860.mRNA.1 putative SH3 domain protein